MHVEPDETADERPEAAYPDTAVGALMRQRDQLLAAADQDDGMAVVFADKARAGRDRAAQLQAAIDAMPPDPS